MLDAVDGAGGQHVIEALADIAPALAHHVVAYGFGDVYNRPGLTPPQRQLVTLGMLTALGGCEPQLEVHVNAALKRRAQPGRDRRSPYPRRGLLWFPEGVERDLRREARVR